MSIHIDLDALEASIRNLDVRVKFTSETGFPYLRDKLGEVMEKNHIATDVMCQVISQMDLVRREITAQALLYQMTHVDAHKDAQVEAKGQMETLKSIQQVLKLHLDRLRRLPHDIRLYTRVLEGALAVEPRYGQALPPPPTVHALPTELSSMGRALVSDPVVFNPDGAFEADDLNVEDLFDVRTP